MYRIKKENGIPSIYRAYWADGGEPDLHICWGDVEGDEAVKSERLMFSEEFQQEPEEETDKEATRVCCWSSCD